MIDQKSSARCVTNAAMEKVPVGILGATGAVGQRFVQQLEDHKWFRVHALGASERSSGSTYGSVVRWLQTTPIPEYAKEMQVINTIRTCTTPGEVH